MCIHHLEYSQSEVLAEPERFQQGFIKNYIFKDCLAHLLSRQNKIQIEECCQPPRSFPSDGDNRNMFSSIKSDSGLVAAIAFLFIVTVSLEAIAHTGLLSWPSDDLEYTESQTTANNASRLDCGSTPEEARSLGCFFDQLSFAWQVPECYDEETITEFLAASEWQYFDDEAGTTRVSSQVVARGERSVHVTSQFHATHCLFLRRQMVRVFENGRPIDSHLWAYKHTVHCGQVLTNATWMGGYLHTRAPIIYPECRTLKDWNS